MPKQPSLINNCLVCGAPINHKGNHICGKSKRSVLSVTCGRQHARIYQRIATHVRRTAEFRKRFYKIDKIQLSRLYSSK